jgi:hypothetical protein
MLVPVEEGFEEGARSGWIEVKKQLRQELVGDEGVGFGQEIPGGCRG